MTSPYPEIVMRALELAATWHANQLRKHPVEKIPYIVHPAGVAILLERCGADDETIAAGVLHDVLEDCDVTIEELARATTVRVAKLVAETTEEKGLDWETRKSKHRARLPEISREGLLILAADHVHNLHALVGLLKLSSDTWSMFHSGRDQRIAHEELVFAHLKHRLGRHPLVLEFEKILKILRDFP